jgi:hypothetical protein
MYSSEIVVRYTSQTHSSTISNLTPATCWTRFFRRTVFGLVSLFVLGSLAVAQSKLTPASLSFGSVAVGATSKQLTATFKNAQKTSLTIGSIAISGGNASGDYAWAGSCPISPKQLAAGSSCSITVTFTPSALGNRIATLTVTSSSSSSPQSIALAGIGIAPVTVSPTSLAFASTLVGATSVAKPVTLTNHLNVPLAMSTVATTGDFAVTTNTCSPSVGAGLKCTIEVTFSPEAIGTLSGALTINYNAVGSPTLVPLSGTGSDTGLKTITVTPANSTIAAGSTLQFTATGNFKNGSTENLTSAVTWSSTTTSVATIAPGGLATALTVGATTIRATLGSIADSTQLTVTPPTLVSIAVTPPNPSISNGATQQFTATGTYSNATTQNITNSVTWASSNLSVASISASGLATGGATGTSNITATLGGVTSPAATLSVTTALLSIAVTPANPSIAMGTNLALKATGHYSDGSTQDLTSLVSWSSSSPAVTVSNANGSQGVATGVSVGSATVSAASTTTPVVSGSTTVTVTPAALQSIAISPASPSVVAGVQQQFTAIGTYTNGITQNITGSVTWSSSNQTIATISNSAGTQGQATTLSQGSTTITATSGSINGSTILTVEPAILVSISVTPASPSIALGTSQQFIATGNYSDNSTQDITASVTWSAAPGGVVTISNTSGSNGLATSNGQGTTTITATSGSISGNTQLTVTGAVLTSITVNPAATSIYQGSTQQFTAMGTYSDGSSQDVTATVAWSAGDGSVATVSNSAPQGLATAVAGGVVQIVATYTPAGGSAISSTNTGGGGNLTVVALNSVTVLPANPTIALGTGAPQQFTASASFADGTSSDVTASATWASSNPGVATISNTQGAQGQASPVSAGTTTITATYASVTGFTVLTVTSAPALTSISVLPPAVWVGVGSNTQYTATGTFTDGSTASLTNSVVWSSSDSSIATITATGLATSTGGGVATLTAAQGAVSGSATMTGYPGGFISCGARILDMRVLVVTNAESEADFPAITQALGYIGTPYSVLDISTTGFTIPSGYLSDGGCHGYFQGVIFGFGDNIYNISNVSDLYTYESQFNVRQVNWYVYPDPDFGLAGPSGTIPASSTPYNFYYAPAANTIFPYANVSNPVGITNAAIYLSSSVNGSTPLLTDAYGNVLAAVYNTPFAGQYLSLTFDSNQYLTHDLVLAYGLVNWVTQGIFLGDYHVYATQEVDDFFIDDSEWIPGTSCVDPITQDRTQPDASNLPVFRVNSADMTQLLTWQNTVQTDPSGLFSNFKLTLAFNGVGTAGNGDWTGLTAPITATSSTNDLATFTTKDFSGLPGAQVTVTGTKNAGGIFNGTWTILSVVSNSSTTPATTQFTATVAGAVTTAQQAETGATAAVTDDLVANLQSYQGGFHWISHTYDHPTTLNGLCKSTPTGTGCGDIYDNPPTDDINLEVLTNLWVASSPGGVNLDMDPSDAALAQLGFSDFNPANMVTPSVTGLNDPFVPGYLYADGIQYVVTNTSVIGQLNNGPNPSPNVGIVNSFEPGIYEVPRHPNDIYYNAANWNDDQAEFDCIYSYPTVVPPYNTYTADQILNFVSSSFLNNMLIGDMDPEMFHQPDLHFSINTAPGMPTTGLTSSLLTDTYDQTFSQYKAVYNLPVLTPTLDQLGVLMQNRNSFNLSNVTASIVGAGGPNPVITLTMPSGGTVPAAIIPITGLNSAGAEVYGGQYISYISVTAGQTVTLPLP